MNFGKYFTFRSVTKKTWSHVALAYNISKTVDPSVLSGTSMIHQNPFQRRPRRPTSSFAQITNGLQDERSSAQVTIHRRYVYQLIRLASTKISKRFNGKIEAEDIVQSVFQSFFARHKQGKVSPQTWNELWGLLATMTIRRCCRRSNEFQSDKRNVAREKSLLKRSVGSTCIIDTADRQPTPQEQLMFDEILDRLLDPLTELQKEIVALKLSGHSKVEISRKVGRTERTVHRAFDRIRLRLQEITTEETS